MGRSSSPTPSQRTQGERKRLPHLQRLRGEVEYITAMDFRKSPGDVLMQARMGKVFVLTHQGTPIAVLSPLPGETLTIHVDSKGDVSYGL